MPLSERRASDDELAISVPGFVLALLSPDPPSTEVDDPRCVKTCFARWFAGSDKQRCLRGGSPHVRSSRCLARAAVGSEFGVTRRSVIELRGCKKDWLSPGGG